MVITGRIFDIIEINEKIAQIIIRKKMNDKVVPVAISIFGYWKDKALKELKIKNKDKIRGNLYMKSRMYNNKYYTDVYFREIYLVEQAPVEMRELFMVDKNTGEIIE